MPTLTIRLASSRADADILVTALQGLEGIGRIERTPEPAHVDTSGLDEPADEVPTVVHVIEVEVPDPPLVGRVQELANDAAKLLNAGIEFDYRPDRPQRPMPDPE